eukprot:Ihof_evm1s92 gene=Ihof_evmTU1s92
MARNSGSTKGGRFMNPTDAHRKQERKKEIKKNKVQRKQIREAVLKSKDPKTMQLELEEVDDQLRYIDREEYEGPEKSLKDKRKKLRETLDRVTSLWAKNDLPALAEFQEWLRTHERATWTPPAGMRKRGEVSLDDIPVPAAPAPPSIDEIPLPSAPMPNHEDEKEPQGNAFPIQIRLLPPGPPMRPPNGMMPPGPPPGPPPGLPPHMMPLMRRPPGPPA